VSDDKLLMDDLLETVSYAGDVRDWRDLPALGEGDDDETVALRDLSDFDESKHPRDKEGQFTDGTGSGSSPRPEPVQKFIERFKDYQPELDAYAKAHGEEQLAREIAGVTWGKARGMVLDNVTPEFEQMLRDSQTRQRADAKKAKKEAGAKAKPIIAKQLFEKYGLKEGDKVHDSESGQPGTVKFDGKGQPFIRTRDFGDVLVGDRWSNKPRTAAEFEESQHPRDDDGKFTEVGITSARPEGDPGHTDTKVVFARMRKFEGNLKLLPGVENVRVQPGVGAWQGGSEPTWVVSYKGNGEATKLLAQTAKDYNQDAVLVLKGDGGEGGKSVASEFVFDRGVDSAERDAVHAVLAAEGIGGWTWFKRSGHTVLRAVAVPQWGGDPTVHHAASQTISETLARHGFTHRLLEKPVSVTVLERDKGDYDRLTAKG